jgi:Asp-tRNA(Asn)/Glu-tRNA(Gln) amidotransferase C subunit
MRPGLVLVDLRVARRFPIHERLNLELIDDMFNVINRFNVGDVSPLCNPLDPATCRAGEPTASLDPRQFQFALKLNW